MVQGTVSKWLSAAGILLAALLLSSCQKSGRPPAAPPPAPLSLPTSPAAPAQGPAATGSPAAGPSASVGPAAAAPSPGKSAAPFATPSPPPAPRPGTAPAGIALQPQPAAQSTRGLASATVLLALGRETRVLPEDFKIGPLGDDRVSEKDQGQAMEAAGRFLSGLVAGKVDKDLIVDGSRDAMAATLSFGLEKGNTPTSWRIGRPRTRDDGEVTAAVRLFGREGSTEGEIYVERSGSKWLVADLQISLAELSVKSEKPKEKFFPLEYRWLLEE